MQVKVKNAEGKVVFFAAAKTSRGLNLDQQAGLLRARAGAATVPVACNCCRQQVATWLVKDSGFRTYPVCESCKKCMIVVDAAKLATAGR